MENRIISKASMIIFLIAVIAYSQLAAEQRVNSYYHLTHTKTQVPMFMTALTSPPLGMVFLDKFSCNLLDETIGTLATLNEYNCAPQAQVGVGQNQGLEITPSSDASGTHYPAYVSESAWNVTNGPESFEDGNLYLLDKGTGQKNSTDVTYNSAQPRFRRLHNYLDSDQAFETSSDAVNWVVQQTVSGHISTRALRLQPDAGTHRSLKIPGSSMFDNFLIAANNVSPGSTPTLQSTSTPTPIPAPTPRPAGCTWFVSTNGSSAGDGTIAHPWSLRTLFNGDPGFGGVAPPSAIKPGAVVCLRGGTYKVLTAPADYTLHTVLAGNPGAQVTIQPYPGEHVIIDTNGITDGSNGAEQDPTIIISGNGYLTIRDLEIMNSSTDRVDWRAGGIGTSAPGVRIINNVIHDVGVGINTNDSATNTLIYGNVLFNNGWDDTNTGLHQGGTGHGLYIQNRTGFLRVYDNLIASSFGYGIHGYVTQAHLNNFDIQHNVSYDNGYWTNNKVTPYCGSSGVGCEGSGSPNFFFGSGSPTTPIVNLVLSSNYGFHRQNRFAENLQVGYRNVPNTSAIIQNNTFLGGGNIIDSFQTVTFTGNWMASPIESLEYYAIDPTNLSGQTINSNTYYYYPALQNGTSLCGSKAQLSGSFGFQNYPSLWKRATRFDADSTFYPCGKKPAGLPVQTFLRLNTYDSNRANLIVYNYGSASSVTVDLSKFLSNGTLYEIRNGQDYYGAPVLSGTYTGPVTIDMNGLNIARPTGWAGPMPRSSGPQFGAFVLIKR